MYKILTIDGGGIRGIATATLLDRIFQEYPDPDLIAGTSTGGIIALAKASGMPFAAISGLYKEKGGEIFKRSIWKKLRDGFGLWDAQYPIDRLGNIMHSTFGEKKLSELNKVVVPTFKLNGPYAGNPKIFHNFEGEDCDGEELVWKVATYTCAAPTYFSSFEGYIDGGVVENNPSTIAIAQTQDQRNIGEKIRMENIVLLSVAVSNSPEEIKGGNWGYVEWIKPLIDLLIDANVGIADYQAKILLGDRYFRKNLVLGEKIEMDEWKKIPKLIQAAKSAKIDDAANWMKENWR